MPPVWIYKSSPPLAHSLSPGVAGSMRETTSGLGYNMIPDGAQLLLAQPKAEKSGHDNLNCSKPITGGNHNNEARRLTGQEHPPCMGSVHQVELEPARC
jgi:hypothetical protein